MDAGVSPTKWQASSYPAEYRSKISVIHEGVNTKLVAPDPSAFVTLNGKGLTLRKQDEVITFVNRNLEPYRGFHVFMRALPQLQAERPNAHVLMIGGDGVSYGRQLAQGTYKDMMLKEVGIRSISRECIFSARFLSDFLRVLEISTAHVYPPSPSFCPGRCWKPWPPVASSSARARNQ